MNQKRTKVFSALSALAATTILCLGVSCTQTGPKTEEAPRPLVAPTFVKDTGQPGSAPFVEAGAATFKVSINGGDTGVYPAPTYQWSLWQAGTAADVFVPLADVKDKYQGTTTNTFSWYNTVAADAGSKVKCVITNAAGVLTSNVVELKVPVAVTITGQPTDITAAAVDKEVSFSVKADGFPSPTYMWQKAAAGSTTFADIADKDADLTKYGSRTGKTLTFKVASGDSGMKYRVVVKNTVGSTTFSTVTSNIAVLTIQ